MRTAISILCLVSFGIFSKAQVQQQDLHFINDFEKENFHKLIAGTDGALEIFMVFSPDAETKLSSARTQVDQFVASVKAAKRPSSNEKYLKKVYQNIHDTFLKKYEINVTFDRLFVDGWYNCVTACALYGIIFQKLDIPFVVKKTPTHVYIIGYPDAEQILIETTDPLMGFKTFSPSFKQNFVVQLASLKLIDQAEAGTGVNNIFDKYYFTKEKLGLKELAGIHYYNHGLDFIEKNEFMKASWDLEKAYTILPDDKQTSEVYLGSLALALSNSSYPNFDHVYALAELAGFIGTNNISTNDIINEFNRFLYFNLTNKNDTVFAKKGYEHMIATVTSEEVIKEVKRSYNYERARLSYNRGKFDEGFRFSKEAYLASPGNLDSENLMRTCLANLALSNYDPQLILNEVETLIQTNGELKSNVYFSAILAELYLARMGEEFDKKNQSQALSFKSKFEELYDAAAFGKVSDYAIGKAYSKACVYYFKRGMDREARAILKKGLAYSPNNSELRSRQYMLSN